MEIGRIILKWFGVIGAAVFGWLGDMPSTVRILLLVMAFDLFAGIAQAIVKKNLSSEIAFNGVAKKAVILIIVTLSYTVSAQIAGVDASAPIGQIVAGFYIAVESISILEKAESLNVPIPEFIKTALNKMQDHNRRATDSPAPAVSPIIPDSRDDILGRTQ